MGTKATTPKGKNNGSTKGAGAGKSSIVRTTHK